MKADKAKGPERIDGIVASLMALGRAMESNHDRPSRYDTEGITFV
jgi:phage terminase large subunit-like protein